VRAIEPHLAEHELHLVVQLVLMRDALGMATKVSSMTAKVPANGLF
jgi:hypothetical protein